MARITIEDCIENVPNHFDLVQMAAIRAKQLKKGANALVKADDNKEVVTALREIAVGLITHEMLDSQEVSTEDEEVELSLSLGGGLPEDRLGDDEPV